MKFLLTLNLAATLSLIVMLGVRFEWMGAAKLAMLSLAGLYLYCCIWLASIITNFISNLIWHDGVPVFPVIR
jgi:hypothetical protein